MFETNLGGQTASCTFAGVEHILCSIQIQPERSWRRFSRKLERFWGNSEANVGGFGANLGVICDRILLICGANFARFGANLKGEFRADFWHIPGRDPLPTGFEDFEAIFGWGV